MPHVPVLLKETIEVLDPKPGEFFIDGTLGSGGHAIEIFKRILPGGKLLGIDWDKNNLAIAREKISAELITHNSLRQLADKTNLILVQGNYTDLPEILRKLFSSDLKNLKSKSRVKDPRADGLLLDLGFSSEQIEKSGRGFSFMRDEKLDMRYDPEQGMSAAEAINQFSEKELADIFWKYGEEKRSRQIAKAVVESRRKNRILTSGELVGIIQKIYPRIISKINPATKVFQALRIYVNNELGNLEELLKKSDKMLKNKGRMAIISFHSLEDKIVKNSFKEMARQNKAKLLTKKPIVPTREEIVANPRSRSAKLRAIQLTSSK